MQSLSVSTLNEQIKTLLETSFTRVLVEGELSRITFHNSGHIYFTLKDSSSSVSCVMFRGNATKLKFQLEEGMKIILDGAITLYKPRGSYQINCFSIEPSGQGALALAYEQLKQKLQDKGYFSPDAKKTLPRFPKKIALVTSGTGAALQDMLKVAHSRYRDIEIDIYDTLVQGENAAWSIATAISKADIKEYDIIVTGRGGGSMEDLWAFNEEAVADAIFLASTPIVSAVGHEVDTVISDFVADLRAPTPSAAMQMILPDTNELLQYIDGLATQFINVVGQKIIIKMQEIKHLQSLYAQNSIDKKIMQKLDEIKQLKQNYSYAIDNVIKTAQNQVLNLTKMLESSHPKFKVKKGFAQVSQNSKVIDLSTLEVDDDFNLMSDAVNIRAKVIKKENI